MCRKALFVATNASPNVVVLRPAADSEESCGDNKLWVPEEPMDESVLAPSVAAGMKSCIYGVNCHSKRGGLHVIGV